MSDMSEWQEDRDFWVTDEMTREQMRRDDDEDRERDSRDLRDRDMGESRKEWKG